jgi:hypothetical protein
VLLFAREDTVMYVADGSPVTYQGDYHLMPVNRRFWWRVFYAGSSRATGGSSLVVDLYRLPDLSTVYRYVNTNGDGAPGL